MVRYQRVLLPMPPITPTSTGSAMKRARIKAAAVAGDRHQVQQLADQELPADDVEQPDIDIIDDAQHHAPEVEVGGAEEGQQQREGDVRHGRPTSSVGMAIARLGHIRCEMSWPMLRPAVGLAEIEHEQAHRLIEEIVSVRRGCL
jgi:hypothetical protein